jgi:hypothetical protein
MLLRMLGLVTDHRWWRAELIGPMVTLYICNLEVLGSDVRGGIFCLDLNCDCFTQSLQKHEDTVRRLDNDAFLKICYNPILTIAYLEYVRSMYWHHV